MRITRKYWDWEYHCSATTSAPLSAPCPYSAPDYISSCVPSTTRRRSRAPRRREPRLRWRVISGADCTVTSPGDLRRLHELLRRLRNLPGARHHGLPGRRRWSSAGTSPSRVARPPRLPPLQLPVPATGEGPCVITGRLQTGATLANTETRVYLQDGDAHAAATWTSWLRRPSSTRRRAPRPRTRPGTQFRQMDFGAAALGHDPDHCTDDRVLRGPGASGRRTSLAVQTCQHEHRQRLPGLDEPDRSEGIFFFPNGQVKLTGQPELLRCRPVAVRRPGRCEVVRRRSAADDPGRRAHSAHPRRRCTPHPLTGLALATS